MTYEAVAGGMYALFFFCWPGLYRRANMVFWMVSGQVSIKRLAWKYSRGRCSWWGDPAWGRKAAINPERMFLSLRPMFVGNIYEQLALNNPTRQTDNLTDGAANVSFNTFGNQRLTVINSTLIVIRLMR